MDGTNLKVGDKLWYVTMNYSRPVGQEVLITAVGRRWLALSNLTRADKRTLVVDHDGCGYPPQLWLSKAAHEASTRRQDLWVLLRRQVQDWRVPDDVSAEQIEMALAAISPKNST